MENQFQREEMLIGKEKLEKLKKSTVIIYGIGGVGSFVCEALARAGIGHLILVDFDKVDITNINRQIIATYSNIGKLKTEVMKERISDINPEAIVETYNNEEVKIKEETLITEKIDYIADCVDTISTKIKLIQEADYKKVPIISSMGTGNKLDPTKFEVSDVYKTSVCPLAKVMRKELKKRQIKKLKVVYSKEEPHKVKEETNKKTPASISFVPSVAGLIMAGEIIKDLGNIGDTPNRS